MARSTPSESEVLEYFKSCSNWGRWGGEDQLGTINYVTPDKRRQAAALVQEGVSVTCSRLLSAEVAPDIPRPMLHYMGSTGERWAGVETPQGQLQSSGDFFGLHYHGYSVTHIDSLAHIFWDGKMYNGVPAEAVTAHQGATSGSVDLIKHGVVTRGVLLDIPKLKGVSWLELGEPVFPEDLESAELEAGVRVESGDALFVRFGLLRQRNEQGPSSETLRKRPGLHAACLPWLHEREVSVLGSDSAQDVLPSGYARAIMPIHQVGIVAMGLWLIDNANLEELTEACQRFGRNEFMLAVGPLRLHNGTGSPVNPLAVF